MAKTFVLLHGAWHGGWCWERVADILRGRGHAVTTPTQTGLGERRHLLSTAGVDEVEIRLGESLVDPIARYFRTRAMRR